MRGLLCALLGFGLVSTAAQQVRITYAAADKRRQDYENCFIVQLKASCTDGQEFEIFNATSGRHGRVWSTAIKGFVQCYVNATELSRLASNPDVESITEDQVVSLAYTEVNAPWGLQRINVRPPLLNGAYTFTATGQGVYVYVVDSGVNLASLDFTGRIVSGADFVGDGFGLNDCNGHGTHVSGTAAGTTFGIAKGAFIVPVRVYSCQDQGAISTLISGINWATQSFLAGLRPGVINFSSGGPLSAPLNAAARGAVLNGLPIVVAAGNSGADACSDSPASEPSVIAVAATELTPDANSIERDVRPSFSNYGACVDLFAPGVQVPSDYIPGPAATAIMDGTSMAAPHVAGAVALFLGVNPTATPAQVRNWILASATPNVVFNAGLNTPNLLLYVGPDSPPVVSPNPSPSPTPSPVPGASPSPSPSPPHVVRSGDVSNTAVLGRPIPILCLVGVVLYFTRDATQ